MPLIVSQHWFRLWLGNILRDPISVRTRIPKGGKLDKYATNSPLVAYLSNLPPFDVLVLTEIGSRNIEIAHNLLEDYNFMDVKPNQNYYGGVGIFWRNDIQNFTQHIVCAVNVYV